MKQSKHEQAIMAELENLQASRSGCEVAYTAAGNELVSFNDRISLLESLLETAKKGDAPND